MTGCVLRVRNTVIKSQRPFPNGAYILLGLGLESCRSIPSWDLYYKLWTESNGRDWPDIWVAVAVLWLYMRYWEFRPDQRIEAGGEDGVLTPSGSASINSEQRGLVCRESGRQAIHDWPGLGTATLLPASLNISAVQSPCPAASSQWRGVTYTQPFLLWFFLWFSLPAPSPLRFVIGKSLSLGDGIVLLLFDSWVPVGFSLYSFSDSLSFWLFGVEFLSWIFLMPGFHGCSPGLHPGQTRTRTFRRALIILPWTHGSRGKSVAIAIWMSLCFGTLRTSREEHQPPKGDNQPCGPITRGEGKMPPSLSPGRPCGQQSLLLPRAASVPAPREIWKESRELPGFIMQLWTCMLIL